MARRNSVPLRRAWEDRYRTPTVHDLLAGVDAGRADLVRWVRDSLRALEGVEEAVAWQGIPWRWSLSYTLPAAEHPWAYLVLQPSHPVLAIPITVEIIAELADKRYTRAIRDGIALAPMVGAVRWTQWELFSRTQAEEVMVLARRARDVRSAAAAQLA